MHRNSALKVPGGKLLKASVESDGAVIRKVRICGDFFIHPEDSIERLEAALKGAARADVRGIVERELADSRLYGVDVNSIVKVVWEALG